VSHARHLFASHESLRTKAGVGVVATADEPLHRSDDCSVGGLRVRGLREEAREADFIWSTDAIDSFGEVVEQSWRLDRFRANPVILFGHQSRELPIGVGLNFGVESVDGNQALVGTIRFATEKQNPKAEQVWQLVLAGILKAVSVGFRTHTTRFETRDGREILVLADNELVETSVVPIPANPETLSRMRQRAVESRAQNRNDKAHRDSASEERTSVNPDELQKALDERTKQLGDAVENTKAADLRAKDAESARAAAQASEKKALDERDAANVARNAAVEKADTMWLASVERDATELIGTKITPGEKPGLIALAKADPEAYEVHIKALRGKNDLPTAVGTRVSSKTKDDGRATQDNKGAALDAAIAKKVEA